MAKILGVFNFASYSHYILGHSLLQELANRGHQVTVISAFDIPNSYSYNNIHLSGIQQKIITMLKMQSEDYTVVDMITMPKPKMISLLHQSGLVGADFTLKHKNVQNLLRSNTTFDMVIVEQFFNDALKGFCYYYKAHCIAFSSIGSSQLNNYLVGNHAPPSFIPDTYLNYNSKMTFIQRMYNTIFSIYSYCLYQAYYLNKQNDLMRKYFSNSPHISEILKNISLVLLNSHISTNHPAPSLPNIIEVGGLHLKPKKLSLDLQRFLDNSPEGVIYFSLGSNIKSKYLHYEKRMHILNAFSKINMTVLWKFEDEELSGKPENVLISKWFPQQAILGHCNVKLFITHGGLLSTTEAVYYGVPLIGIPFVSDQMMNMALMVSNGLGIGISYGEISEEKLLWAIREVLDNKTYRENIMKRSFILHDRPMKPMDTAIYWIEYVLRHGGAHHLRSVSVDLAWYQYFSVDVIMLLLFLITLPLVLLFGCIFKCGKRDLKLKIK